MSREQTENRSVLKVVMLVIGLSLLSWALMSQIHLRALKKEIAEKEMRFAMIELQHNLKIPTEVLYFDFKLSEEAALLRMKGYQNYGVKTLLPYTNLMHSSDGMTGDQGRREFPVEEKTDNYVMQLGDFSQEYYWINHLNRRCQNLSGQMNNGNGLGGYLKQHPEEFDKHIRPMIVRLLDSYRTLNTLYACEVLLAAGDRSDELMGIISILLREDVEKEMAEPMVKEYGLNVTADTTNSNDEYLSKTRNPEWKRIHALTLKLKEKYPMTIGTIIEK